MRENRCRRCEDNFSLIFICVPSLLSVSIRVRKEEPQDRAAVFAVNEAAFGRADEARLVERVRASDAFIPELSLVAELNGELVGHALFSRVHLVDADHREPLLGLGPIAVRPEYQRQGIGGALIREGVRLATEMGERAVALIGHPTYYPRFGFRPGRTFGWEVEFPVPAEVFMVLPLREGAAEQLSGTLRYSAAFHQG